MKNIKEEVMDMINVSFDELCRKCEICDRDNDCVMFKILNGVHNIYGNEILSLREDK